MRPRLRSLEWCVGAVVVGLPAMATAADPPQPDPLIYMGTPVQTCGWPTTVAVQGGGGLCTGTLVAPNLVTYAAHCGGGAKTVRFSEDLVAGQTLQAVCTTNPGYTSQSTDWAYCHLPESVDLPVTPIVYGCETTILQAGAPVAIVGFGQNTDGSGAGTKRWKMSNIGGISWQSNTVQMNGYCQGDSGGPAFIQYPSGTWHALSIVSTGICGGAGTHSLLPGAVSWIEESSGVDITPCFDDEGEWAPNPMCAGFFAGDETGHGTWTNWCEGTPAGGSHDTCGAPFDAVPDDAAPTVTLTSPESGSTFPDDPSLVDLQISVDDGAGWGVHHVWVEINGSDQPSIDADPWEFLDVPFPKGGYTVYAYAEDWAGNIGKSPAVTFGVQQEAPEPPPPEDTGDGDDTGEAGTGDDGESGPGLDDGGSGGAGEDGCGCRTGARGPAGGLLVLGLLALRRRRPHTPAS